MHVPQVAMVTHSSRRTWGKRHYGVMLSLLRCRLELKSRHCMCMHKLTVACHTCMAVYCTDAVCTSLQFGKNEQVMGLGGEVGKERKELSL